MGTKEDPLMDHETIAILLPLLHDAFAGTDLEWATKPAAVGTMAYGTEVTVPGGLVRYRLHLDPSPFEAGSFRACLLRDFAAKASDPATFDRRKVQSNHSTLSTTAGVDWNPVASGVPFSTILSKLIIETQEASANLTRIADGFTNV